VLDGGFKKRKVLKDDMTGDAVGEKTSFLEGL
jgi:hypothetical protein